MYLLLLLGGDLESLGLLLGFLLLPSSESESESLELDKSELEISLEESLSELDSASFRAAC